MACWGGVGVCGLSGLGMGHGVWCGLGIGASVYFDPYIFNVERASSEAPRGSMKYRLTCLIIRLFTCGYRIYL